MTSEQWDGRVIVGIDGSVQSEHALRWAAGRAAARGQGLTMLAAQRPFADTRVGGLVGKLLGGGDWSEIEQQLGEACAGLSERFGGLDVRSEVVSATPADALIKASERAALVVIGTRGLGGVKAKLLGSVADAVAAGALGPVVVVPDELDAAPAAPVVVGIADADGAANAVRFAAREAVAEDRPLVGVRVWERSAMPPAGDPEEAGATAGVVSRETALAERAMSALATEYEGLRREVRVIRGDPAEALTEASYGAALVVVGKRGLGTVAGMVLGSTSRAVLARASCPAAVVP